MLGAGQRDVEEAEPLARCLRLRDRRSPRCALLVRPVLPGGHVEGPPSCPRIHVDHGGLLGGRVPQRGEAHHRELEALGRPDRHDLYRIGLRRDPASGDIAVDLGVVLLFGLGVEDREEGRHPAPAAGVGRLEELDEVIEVRHVAIPVGAAEHPLCDTSLRPDPGEGVRHRVGGQHLRPLAELLLHGDQVRLRQGRDLGRAPPGEPRERVCPHPAGIGGTGQGMEQPPHLFGGRRLQHAAAPGHDGRDTLGYQCRLDVCRFGVPADQDRDVRWADRSVAHAAGPLG